LLEKTKLRAEELDAIPTVLTFDVPPSAMIVGEAVPLLNTPEDRADIIRRIFGIEDVIFLHFDENVMHMPWYEVFMRLVNEFHAVGLVAGHDYHFGYRGQGNPERLLTKCLEMGISCDIISKVTYDGITVSSTYIRTLVAQGEMDSACEFLGHPHCFSGVVRSGYRFGRTMGFPTINLRIPDGVLAPSKGVYATR
jgi:riboflavin kinase/FMN adenylyltransferase